MIANGSTSELVREGKPPFNPPSMNKKYIEDQYHLAVLDFKTARNENEQWEARKTMARLEQIAMQEYGFAYADQLHEKELGRESR